MNSHEIQTSRPNRRRWLRKLGWLGLILVGLLVVAYFALTSNAFLQRVVLPRLAQRMNATITVSQVSFRPFSQVILRDLKVQPRGEETAFQARELRARYRLLAMLGGQINLDEAVVESPVIRFIQKADGTSNWDPILQAGAPEQSGETPPPSAPKPAVPPQVEVRKLAVTGAAIHLAQTQPNGDAFRADIAELNVELAGLKNGQTATCSWAAKFEVNATTATNVSQARGSLSSDWSADLGGDLMPDRVEGQARLALPTATGAFAEAAGLAATLTAKLSATEVKELLLQFTKGGAALGNLTVSGPLDLRKQEGRLQIAVSGIGSEVLNLVGGPQNLAFGATRLAAKCDLELNNQAQSISAAGSLTGADCSVIRAGQSSPKVNFQLDYNLTVDGPGTNATLRQFTLNATQNGTPFLRARLTREMRFGWGQGGAAVPDSGLEVAWTQLDLAQWQALIGPEVKGGMLDGKLGLTVQQAGQMVAFDFGTKLTGYAADYPGHRIGGVDVLLATRGQVMDFKQLELAEYSLRVNQSGQPVMAVKGSGNVNTATQDANLQTELDVFLVPALALMSPPNQQLKSGTVKFAGRIAQKNTPPSQTNAPALTQELLGDFHLANLVLQNAADRPPLELRLNVDVANLDQRVDLRQVQFGLTPTDRARNQVQLTGLVDLRQANAITGNLKLTAEVLDLTAYYDMLEASQTPAPDAPATPAPATPAAAPPAAAEVEPDAVVMPVRQLAAAVDIGRLYLRDVAITNLQATTRLDGSTVTIDPARLILNGAPASAKVDLNLGTPGYQYAVELRATEVPMSPLVNSFQPERKGQIGGTLSLQARIAGAGITGPNLQTNLAGQFEVGTTNLNLKLINVQSSLLKSVINVIIGLPDIIRNPSDALGSIVKNLQGGGEPAALGWVDELSQSPIDVIVLHGQAGQGRVDVQQALVQSRAFEVQTQGPITLAPILTNSAIEFPVGLALNRSLAAKIGQVPAQAPTNVTYVKLPDFLTMQGTLGEPKKKLNYPALGQMALKFGGGIVGGSGQAVAEQLTGALGGLKNVLGGRDSTNTVSTNKPSIKSLLGGLLSPSQATDTNQPPGTNAAPRKQGGLFDLLK